MVKRIRNRWDAVWSVGLRPGSPSALVFAVACVGIATCVRIGVSLISAELIPPDSAVFGPYYSATLVAALVAGGAAGGLAAVLGSCAAYWMFVPPEWTVTQHVVSISLYVAFSAFIVWAAERFRGLLHRVREEESTRRLLNRELAHRIKNMLASVQAIVNQTLPKDQPDVLEKVSGRIAALGATNDLLTRSEWHGASLREILELEFAPYGLGRFHLRGADLECPADVAIWLAMVVHELTTNAIKYGALSSESGRVTVSWADTGGRLDLEWVESGGPEPKLPSGEGFGTKLLRSGVRQFQGQLVRGFEATGLRCMLSLNIRKGPAPGLDIAHDAQLPNNEPRSSQLTRDAA